MKMSNFKMLFIGMTLMSVFISGIVLTQATNYTPAENDVDKIFIDPAGLDNDTPADVAQAGKNLSEPLQSVVIAAKEADAVAQRLAQDKPTAEKVLELSRKKDLAGLKSLLKRDAPNSEIEIKEVKDFTITLTFKVKGQTVTVCGSTDGGCNGGKASVTVK